MHKLFIILLSFLSVSALAQEKQASPADYGVEKNMPVFYEQLKSQLTFPWSWQKKHDSMSFNDWKAEARKQIEATMQMAPPAPDDNSYTVIATEQRDGYTAQKIRFNINRWENVQAYLLIPDNSQSNKKKSSSARSQRDSQGEKSYPALLMLHDHGAHFAIGKEKMVKPFDVDTTLTSDANHWAEICYDGKFVGDELAKAGYVVLSIDALLWGDRSRKEDRADIAGALATKARKQQTYDAQQALASNMLQMGTSWGAWITWDDIRAAHFLSQLPMVDKNRVGCLGFSMGAYRSWMLSALSDDIKASASVCWMNDTEHLMSLTNNQNKGGSAYAMLIPGIRNVMDYPHVASLACPKPTLFYNGDRDKLFPVEGVKNAYNEMHEVWQSQKAADKLVTKIWPEKHFLNRSMQDSILLFFNKYLSCPAKADQGALSLATEKKYGKNIPCHAAPPPTDNVVKVKPFSRETGLTKDNQPKLQEAIDKVAELGGGKVLVAKGVYYICGPLIMKSNVELHLDEGALLKFSGNPRHFLPVVKTRKEGIDCMSRSAMIYADGAENISITGKGAIDGRAGREMSSWADSLEKVDLARLHKMVEDSIPFEQRVFADSTYLRPSMIEFVNCKNVLVEGITFKDSPLWCIHPIYCTDVTVRNVTSFYPDNFGCLPESCSNAVMEGCDFGVEWMQYTHIVKKLKAGVFKDE